MSKILIVDDSPDNLTICSMILERDAHEIYTALNGDEALGIAKEKQPDVVLLDILMPEVDGFQVLRRLKAEPATQNIPVLFVSAHERAAESLFKGLELGADDYIVKPFNSQELRARVSVLARLKRQLDELNRKNAELEAANRALADANDQMARAQRVLEQLAITDPLTALYNRRFFEERMTETLSLVGRHKMVIHLLMFDLDHFKVVNDKYGHPAGDRVLVQFAQILRRCVRLHDIIARIGGEEFVVAMLNIPSDQAYRAAERIRSEVEREPLRISGQSISVTTSVGVATLPAREGERVTLDQLLAAADQALYEAKSHGRNQVVTTSL